MRIRIGQKEFEEIIEYEQIKKRLRLLGLQLNIDYEGKTPVFLGVLNGCFMFMADLMKEIQIPSEVSFVKVASYAGDQRQEEIRELIGLQQSLRGRDVVIVEDIIDTGNTLKKILERLTKEEPASVSVCTLLLKPACLEHELEEITYVGFEIIDQFVVGYGLDYDGLGRNFKNIYQAV